MSTMHTTGAKSRRGAGDFLASLYVHARLNPDEGVFDKPSRVRERAGESRQGLLGNAFA